MAYQPIIDRVKKLVQGSTASTLVSKSIRWFQDKANKIPVTPGQMLKDTSRLTADVFIGKFFMFLYDPKWKKELPYYDKFPLIIPIDIYDDGFLGLNFHYLAPKYRVALMDKLLEYTNNDRMDKTTKLKVSYELLKKAGQLPEIAPCIKRYLSNHVQSNFISIDAQDWAIAIFLPVERFVKESKETVWQKSMAFVKAKTHQQRKAQKIK